jgi:hypothetical protein
MQLYNITISQVLQSEVLDPIEIKQLTKLLETGDRKPSIIDINSLVADLGIGKKSSQPQPAQNTEFDLNSIKVSVVYPISSIRQ